MSGSVDCAGIATRTTMGSARWSFALLLALALTISWGSRVRALREWDTRPDDYQSAGVPGSGSDSYYWFRTAREIANDLYVPGERDALRAWPEGDRRGPLPAFAWLIASMSPVFDGDVYRTGIVLNVVLSSLFIVPLALYAQAIGFPLAGLLGGFTGGLGRLYVQRSSVGRVDTDGGTLLGVFLLAFAIGAIRSSASLRRNILAAALAGLSLAAFCRWYDQPGFWLVYSATFALHLFFGGFARREAIGIGLAFLVCSNPLAAIPGLAGLTHFLRYYVFRPGATLATPLDYAHITSDIAELQPIPLVETLANVVDTPGVAALGLGGFVAFGLLHRRRVIPLLPVVLLGAYSLVGPQRFGIFLAPLVGFGLGYLLHSLAAAWKRFAAAGSRFAEPAVQVGAVVIALLLLEHTGYANASEPRIPARTIASLQRLASVLPPDAAILASWGNGYLIADVTHAATFNDGEAPDPLVHYLHSRAVTSRDPAELMRIVSLLARPGRSELRSLLGGRPDPEPTIERIANDGPATPGNVVLVLMGSDIVPFPATFRTGQFDFVLGSGPELGYFTSECARTKKRRALCTTARGERIAIDLATGRMGDGSRLRRFVEVRDSGRALESVYATGGNLSLILLPQRSGESDSQAYLVPEAVYQSNFNQLFFLGRFDPSMLEEIHRDLPVMRAYRIRARSERPAADDARAVLRGPK